jgi:acetolactate synthase-1/2/3 large subunit
MSIRFENTAQALLALLALRGIDYFLANAGTDFASIADGFARRIHEGKNTPKPMAIPHENPLFAMAHGYYMVSGKPLAAMVHVNVGTANALGALMNAHRSRTPVLFMAGRTPIMESGIPGCRSLYIHWNQESFDQAAMVREYVKWDYELRHPSQLESVLDRALAIAMSEPKGPVYLTLPREILAAPYEGPEFCDRHRYDLPRRYPDPAKIETVGRMLADAEFPVVITSAAGRDSETVEVLAQFANTAGCGVVSFNPEFMNFPLGHPLHLGFDPEPYLSEADLILAVECDIPWYQNRVMPRKNAKLVHIGVDPLYSHLPLRSHPSDVTLVGKAGVVLNELCRMTAAYVAEKEAFIETRKKKNQDRHQAVIEGLAGKDFSSRNDGPIDPAYASACLNSLLTGDEIVVNEYDNCMKNQPKLRAGHYFCSPHGGHLGWGLGAALGAKLARPDKTVLATIGDGSYLFNVPSACHSASAAHDLPFLTIVYNNQSWHAVKRATLGMHPQGWAARSNMFPFTTLYSGAAYEKICEAFGGHGESIVNQKDVAPALERALRVVREEKRQALVNLVCKCP